MTTRDDVPRILVVEDDPHIQFLLRYVLQRHFRLELTDSIEDALEAARHQHFELFLLDINLGSDGSGVDLLRALRRMPEHQTTPAIACTAYALKGDQDRFLAQGFSGYLDKPFTQDNLFAVIEASLNGMRPSEPAALHALPGFAIEAFHGVAA